MLAGARQQAPARGSARPDVEPGTATADESLEVARSRVEIADPPDWFGVIKPSRLLTRRPDRARQQAMEICASNSIPTRSPTKTTTDEDEQSEESKILKLFETPVPASQALVELPAQAVR